MVVSPRELHNVKAPKFKRQIHYQAVHSDSVRTVGDGSPRSNEFPIPGATAAETKYEQTNMKNYIHDTKAQFHQRLLLL